MPTHHFQAWRARRTSHGSFGLLALCLTLCLALALPAWGAPAKPKAPPKPPVPMLLPAHIEPLAYNLHLEVDPAQSKFSGEVQIDLKILPAAVSRADASTIRLHAKDLHIRAVWLETGAKRWVAKVLPVDAERVDLRFAQPVPPGPARLGLVFAGTQQEQDVYGLFRQKDGPGANSGWMSFTQFEAVGARLAFPLFDEPGWKVPWTISLTVPQGLQAFANTAQRSEEDLGNGRKRVSFEPTPPLPSYLVAFAVGAFDVLDGGKTESGVPMRYIAPRGRAGEAKFAAQHGGAVVKRLEDFFGMPHPYAKIDSLAIPVTLDFSAMEHPGLITYGANVMLASPTEQTPNFERYHLSTAAHELAHQWFGNLVTPKWWDDLWLNESFASWLGDRVTAQVMPDWGWETATQAARAKGMKADRLLSARRIYQPVLSDEDMGNLWDAITYEKGQTVLAMFEGWMGPEKFQAGVRRYMQRHAWGHASSADFFAALAVDAPGMPEAVRTFTHQPGIPRLDVNLLCDGGPPRLQLAQSRLLPLGSAGAPTQALWQIPVRVRTPAGESRLLMDKPQAELPLPDAQCPAWVQANADGVGYYRPSYAGSMLNMLAHAPQASAGEVLALLHDAIGLHDAGDLSSAQALALVTIFARHPRHEVVEAAIELLLHLQTLVGDADQARYAQAWQTAFGDLAQRLDWSARPDDSTAVRQVRRRLLPAMAIQGQDTRLQALARQAAQAWFSQPQSVPAAMRAAVLKTAAATAPDADAPALHEAMLQALLGGPAAPVRADLLAALAAFRQPALVQRTLGLLLDRRIDIRESEDVVLKGLAEVPSSRRAALVFVSERHADLAKLMARDEPAGLPSYFRAACSADEGRQIEQVFAKRAKAYLGGQVTLDRALESVRLCAAWQAHHGSPWASR